MKKNKFSLPILLLLVIILAGGVLGAATFNTPATNGVVRANYLFNVTVSIADPANCSITGSSALSGGTLSATTIDTVVGANVTDLINTATLRDAADWTFTGTCYNSTGHSETITAITGVKIDNTVPTITGCLIDSQTAASGTVYTSSPTISCIIKNATSCNAYWKTASALTFLSSSQASRSDMELSTFTASSSYGGSGATVYAYPRQATTSGNNFYLICTDGLNTTTSTVYEIDSQGLSSAQKAQKSASILTFYGEGSEKNIGAVLFIVIGIAAIFILVATFAKTKKK